MKSVLLIFFLFSMPYFSFGQNFRSKSKGFNYDNTAQLELFGHGGFYSVNYERFIINNSKLKTSVLIGTAYYPENTGIINLWLPVSINQLLSFNSSHIEFGIGHIFALDIIELEQDGSSTTDLETFISGRIGYRFQQTNSRILIRGAYMPILDYTSDNLIFSWAALSFGYAF